MKTFIPPQLKGNIKVPDNSKKEKQHIPIGSTVPVTEKIQGISEHPYKGTDEHPYKGINNGYTINPNRKCY